MVTVRRLAGAAVLATAVAAPVAAQRSTDLSRIVGVQGNPTRVMTVGLEDREASEPVLVLQSGAGSAMSTWARLIPLISPIAPLVAYERPGVGSSAFDGVDPTPLHVSQHLHALLDVMEIEPPYILVGHSRGGTLILYYAGRYPEEVVGMVYLDPPDPTLTREEFLMTSDPDELATRQAELDGLSANGPQVSAARRAEARVAREFMDSPVEARGIPEDPIVPTAFVVATGFQQLGVSFMDERYQTAMNELRVGRFRRRIEGLPASTLQVVTDGGHFVHRYASELVAESIRRVVEAVRAGR